MPDRFHDLSGTAIKKMTRILLGKTAAIARRWLHEEAGQDLIEYALLTGAIGFAGVAGIAVLGQAINVAYGSWDTGVNSIWETPPGSGTP